MNQGDFSLIGVILNFSGFVQMLEFSRMECSQAAQDKTYDCSGQGLLSIPDSLPPYTTGLDFSFNTLPFIHNSTFIKLKELIDLDLTRCQINWIYEDAFQYQINLQTLVLIGNQFMFIADNAFSGPVKLKHLFLTQTALSTLRFVPSENLNWLETLDFGNNDIYSLQFLSSFTTRNLKNLDFQLNGIQKIHATDVEVLKHAVGLNLNFKGNDIIFIEPGAFDSCQFNSLDFSGCLDEADLSVILLGLKGLSTRVLKLGTYEDTPEPTDITPTSLQGLCDITVEELSFQLLHFKDFSNTTFQCLTRLRKLDLTRSHISFLPSNIQGMDSLTHLILNENNFRNVCLTSTQNFPALTHLSLKGNSKMLQFHQGCLQALSKLEHLDMSHSFLQTGSCCGIQLKGLGSLLHLNMSYNSKMSMQGLPFSETPNLLLLDLTRTPITYSASRGPFHNLHQLQTLNLSHTYTNTSNVYLLEGLQSLRVLSLQGNSFQSGVIQDSEMFKCVLKLEILILSECQLTAIADKAFEPLRELKYVDVSKNNLFKFNSHAFVVLKDIQLNFARNNIEIIAVEQINLMQPSSKIRLSYNPLLCNCSNLHFITWYQQNMDKILDPEETVCGSPMPGTRVADVHLSCGNHLLLIILLVLSAVLISTLAAVAGRKCCIQSVHAGSCSYQRLETYQQLS
ncbi:CD180 antigen-like [Acipenser oxyrinchus oxyrinchus]|uniref:CD180 antigen-like n=1 Tax=Acipenser oxyrinchus oxyrinchus TaxID=40147 RepID=A0AAD8GHS8_ACIOX|nr:CD180 antigen-like [Acipenser oxyrinchus oxyrinchus]